MSTLLGENFLLKRGAACLLRISNNAPLPSRCPGILALPVRIHIFTALLYLALYAPIFKSQDRYITQQAGSSVSACREGNATKDAEPVKVSAILLLMASNSFLSLSSSRIGGQRVNRRVV